MKYLRVVRITCNVFCSYFFYKIRRLGGGGGGGGGESFNAHFREWRDSLAV
jgi:hypothetical protein